MAEDKKTEEAKRSHGVASKEDPKKNTKASGSKKTPPAPPTVDEHGGTLPSRVPDEADDTPAKDKPDRQAAAGGAQYVPSAGGERSQFIKDLISDALKDLGLGKTNTPGPNKRGQTSKT